MTDFIDSDESEEAIVVLVQRYIIHINIFLIYSVNTFSTKTIEKLVRKFPYPFNHLSSQLIVLYTGDFSKVSIYSLTTI